jgi:hypothetical protein
MRLRVLVPPAVLALCLTGCATDVQVGTPTIDAELVAADGERRVTVYQGEQWLFPPGSPAP